MSRVRLVAEQASSSTATTPCIHCEATGVPWDCLAGKVCCPDCMEAMVRGEGPAFIARLEDHRCCVCSLQGTVAFRTVSLDRRVLAFDLCRGHLRGLLARRLDRRAFAKFRGQLAAVGVQVNRVFLLHDAFYDEKGRALQPVE